MDGCLPFPAYQFSPHGGRKFHAKKGGFQIHAVHIIRDKQTFQDKQVIVFETASRNAHANQAHYRNVLCVKEGSALTIQLLYFFAF